MKLAGYSPVPLLVLLFLLSSPGATALPWTGAVVDFALLAFSAVGVITTAGMSYHAAWVATLRFKERKSAAELKMIEEMFPSDPAEQSGPESDSLDTCAGAYVEAWPPLTESAFTTSTTVGTFPMATTSVIGNIIVFTTNNLPLLNLTTEVDVSYDIPPEYDMCPDLPFPAYFTENKLCPSLLVPAPGKIVSDREALESLAFFKTLEHRGPSYWQRFGTYCVDRKEQIEQVTFFVLLICSSATIVGLLCVLVVVILSTCTRLVRNAKDAADEARHQDQMRAEHRLRVLQDARLQREAIYEKHKRDLQTEDKQNALDQQALADIADERQARRVATTLRTQQANLKMRLENLELQEKVAASEQGARDRSLEEQKRVAQLVEQELAIRTKTWIKPHSTESRGTNTDEDWKEKEIHPVSKNEIVDDQSNFKQASIQEEIQEAPQEKNKEPAVVQEEPQQTIKVESEIIDAESSSEGSASQKSESNGDNWSDCSHQTDEEDPNANGAEPEHEHDRSVDAQDHDQVEPSEPKDQHQSDGSDDDEGDNSDGKPDAPAALVAQEPIPDVPAAPESVILEASPVVHTEDVTAPVAQTVDDQPVLAEVLPFVQTPTATHTDSAPVVRHEIQPAPVPEAPELADASMQQQVSGESIFSTAMQTAHQPQVGPRSVAMRPRANRTTRNAASSSAHPARPPTQNSRQQQSPRVPVRQDVRAPSARPRGTETSALVRGLESLFATRDASAQVNIVPTSNQPAQMDWLREMAATAENSFAAASRRARQASSSFTSPEQGASASRPLSLGSYAVEPPAATQVPAFAPPTLGSYAIEPPSQKPMSPTPTRAPAQSAKPNLRSPLSGYNDDGGANPSASDGAAAKGKEEVIEVRSQRSLSGEQREANVEDAHIDQALDDIANRLGLVSLGPECSEPMDVVIEDAEMDMDDLHDIPGDIFEERIILERESAMDTSPHDNNLNHAALQGVHGDLFHDRIVREMETAMNTFPDGDNLDHQNLQNIPGDWFHNAIEQVRYEARDNDMADIDSLFDGNVVEEDTVMDGMTSLPVATDLPVPPNRSSTVDFSPIDAGWEGTLDDLADEIVQASMQEQSELAGLAEVGNGMNQMASHEEMDAAAGDVPPSLELSEECLRAIDLILDDQAMPPQDDGAETNEIGNDISQMAASDLVSMFNGQEPQSLDNGAGLNKQEDIEEAARELAAQHDIPLEGARDMPLMFKGQEPPPLDDAAGQDGRDNGINELTMEDAINAAARDPAVQMEVEAACARDMELLSAGHELPPLNMEEPLPEDDLLFETVSEEPAAANVTFSNEDTQQRIPGLDLVQPPESSPPRQAREAPVFPAPLNIMPTTDAAGLAALAEWEALNDELIRLTEGSENTDSSEGDSGSSEYSSDDSLASRQSPPNPDYLPDDGTEEGESESPDDASDNASSSDSTGSQSSGSEYHSANEESNSGEEESATLGQSNDDSTGDDSDNTSGSKKSDREYDLNKGKIYRASSSGDQDQRKKTAHSAGQNDAHKRPSSATSPRPDLTIGGLARVPEPASFQPMFAFVPTAPVEGRVMRPLPARSRLSLRATAPKTEEQQGHKSQ